MAHFSFDELGGLIGSADMWVSVGFVYSVVYIQFSVLWDFDSSVEEIDFRLRPFSGKLYGGVDWIKIL